MTNFGIFITTQTELKCDGLACWRPFTVLSPSRAIVWSPASPRATRTPPISSSTRPARRWTKRAQRRL